MRANIISFMICIAGSLLGAILSLVYIFSASSSEAIEIATIKFPVPFMTFTARMDGISAFFILLLSVITFFVSIYSIGYIKHYDGSRRMGMFSLLYPAFIVSMLLVFLSGNMIMFFVAWEIMSLTSYFLVAFEGEKKQARDASTLYIIMTHIGTAALLIAFVIIYMNTESFDMRSLQADLPQNTRNLLFILFLIGFGTKAGLVPLHVWLPYAHPAAPSNISALMSGIMIKTAIYGMVRFIFEILGVHNTWWAILMIALGILSIVVGVTYAFIEKNMKRLLAYSSIENIGIILLGLGISALGAAKGNSILQALGLAAAMIHTMNHMLFKGLMFLAAGSVDYAIHTKNIEEMGGLMKVMPFTGLFTVAGSLAISAIVPFNGFLGEWLTVQSLMMTVTKGGAVINIIAVTGIACLGLAAAMAAGTFIKLIGIAFLGKARTKKCSEAEEVPKSMLFSKGMLAILCLLAGIFPMPLILLFDNSFIGMTKYYIASNMYGSILFSWYPIKFGQSSVMPASLPLIFLIFFLVILILRRIFGGKTKERTYGTWDCGFVGLTQRMQYTATGFSKPIAMILRMLYQPFRNVEVKGSSSPYHPEEIVYALSMQNIFEKYLYKPFLRMVARRTVKFKFGFQTGSMHLYLVYIFAALFAFLIYNKIV